MAKVVISSGHSLYVAGAIDIVNEVTEARKITDQLAKSLKIVGVEAVTYHDNVSKTKSANVNNIVKVHNGYVRDLDVSVHLNASGGTKKEDIGVEVLYYGEATKKLATDVSKAIAEATGLKNRGAKQRTDLGFLRGTNKPSILIECYFVNSYADAEKMDEVHEVKAFSDAVAKVLAQYLGVKVTQSPTPTQAVTTKYRIKTGTFKTQEAALKVVELLGKFGLASSKYCSVAKENGLYRVYTGTYSSKEQAEKVVTKGKDNGLWSTAYVIVG